MAGGRQRRARGHLPARPRRQPHGVGRPAARPVRPAPLRRLGHAGLRRRAASQRRDDVRRPGRHGRPAGRRHRPGGPAAPDRPVARRHHRPAHGPRPPRPVPLADAAQLEPRVRPRRHLGRRLARRPAGAARRRPGAGRLRRRRPAVDRRPGHRRGGAGRPARGHGAHHGRRPAALDRLPRHARPARPAGRDRPPDARARRRARHRDAAHLRGRHRRGASTGRSWSRSRAPATCSAPRRRASSTSCCATTSRDRSTDDRVPLAPRVRRAPGALRAAAGRGRRRAERVGQPPGAGRDGAHRGPAAGRPGGRRRRADAREPASRADPVDRRVAGHRRQPRRHRRARRRRPGARLHRRGRAARARARRDPRRRGAGADAVERAPGELRAVRVRSRPGTTRRARRVVGAVRERDARHQRGRHRPDGPAPGQRRRRLHRAGDRARVARALAGRPDRGVPRRPHA